MALSPEELLKRATRFSFLPEGADFAYRNDHHFEIAVELRGTKWAVCSMGAVWSEKYGEWVGDTKNAEHNNECVTRFELDKALELAQGITEEGVWNTGYSWENWKTSPERRLLDN